MWWALAQRVQESQRAQPQGLLGGSRNYHVHKQNQGAPAPAPQPPTRATPRLAPSLLSLRPILRPWEIFCRGGLMPPPPICVSASWVPGVCVGVGFHLAQRCCGLQLAALVLPVRARLEQVLQLSRHWGCSAKSQGATRYSLVQDFSVTGLRERALRLRLCAPVWGGSRRTKWGVGVGTEPGLCFIEAKVGVHFSRANQSVQRRQLPGGLFLKRPIREQQQRRGSSGTSSWSHKTPLGHSALC